MTRVASKAKNTIEMIKALSKEELIELISQKWFMDYSEREVVAARAAVLRKKADAAFKEYEAFNIPDIPSRPSLHQQIEWLKRLKEKESLYRRYEKLWKRADKIEFGK